MDYFMDFNPFFAPNLQHIEDPVQEVGIIKDVVLDVDVEFGRTEMRVQDILNITPGSTLILNRNKDEPMNVYINGKLVAHGEPVVINEEGYGIRITEILKENN